MKRVVSIILCVCIMLSLGQVAYANETEPVKWAGLADETALLEKKGFIKNSDAAEVFFKEEFDVYTNLQEENLNLIVENDKPKDLSALLDKYRGNDILSESHQSASLFATVSYYPGTTIATYTSVTGWPLRNT